MQPFVFSFVHFYCMGCFKFNVSMIFSIIFLYLYLYLYVQQQQQQLQPTLSVRLTLYSQFIIFNRRGCVYWWLLLPIFIVFSKLNIFIIFFFYFFTIIYNLIFVDLTELVLLMSSDWTSGLLSWIENLILTSIRAMFWRRCEG